MNVPERWPKMRQYSFLPWEFPPFFAGGVGTVCHALTKALVNRGHHVTYVMPKGPEELKAKNPFLNLRIANNEKQLPISIRSVDSLLGMPYDGSDDYAARYRKYLDIMSQQGKTGKLYGEDLLTEVQRFAQQAVAIALTEDFDVIHAHDWTTVPAAIAVKRRTGKPLIMHVHITEFDKTGGEHADPDVYRIEYDGFHAADRIIAVSNLVKQRLIEKYYVPAQKIVVIHNAVEGGHVATKRERLTNEDHIVLFLGRVTLQKGPDYFLEAAARVTRFISNVRFVVAGTGDMLPREP